ncbi:MAG: hypothetical protein QM754_14535 [Tepidisphaeraceae bacterium]
MSNATKRNARSARGSRTLRAFVFIYLAIFVGLPLIAAVPPLLRESPAVIWEKITDPVAIAALKLSASAAATGC